MLNTIDSSDYKHKANKKQNVIKRRCLRHNNTRNFE
jgi:hypothetical protein